MPHTYHYGNKEHTVIVRDDGSWIELEHGRNIHDVHGAFAEQYRLDGVPAPAPYTKLHTKLHAQPHVLKPISEPEADSKPAGLTPPAPPEMKRRARKHK